MELFTEHDTASIVATTSSARVAVPYQTNGVLRVCNVGGVAVFVQLGDSTVAASLASSIPILPGTVELFGVPRNPDLYVAAITESSTSRISFSIGQGEL